MTEQAAAPATQAEEVQNQNPTIVQNDGQLTPEGKQVADLLALVNANPAAADDPEIKAILEGLNKFQAEKKTAPVAKEETSALVTEPKKEDKKEGASTFFGSTTSTNKVEFKTPDDWKQYIDKKFSIKDESTFFDSVDKWRKDSQEKIKLEEAKTNYDRLFEELPDDIYSSIEAWGKGENYKEVFHKNSAPFDFSKDFDKQDMYDVVSKYFPGKFEKEDLSGSYKDLDITAQRAFDVAKEKFTIDRQQFNNRRADLQKQADEKVQKLRQSAVSSVKKLEQSFPEFDRQRISEIQKRLNSGDVLSMIYNKDGSYNENAAIRLSYMLYGEEEIANARQLRNASQTQLEESVSRKSDNPTIRGAQESAVTPASKAVEQLERLIPKTYY